MRPLFFAAGIALLVGCRSAADRPRSTDAQTAPCTRVGQTCEFAPNKLGSCVERDNCTVDCLVCQSQH
jgi:hypothetical protein